MQYRYLQIDTRISFVVVGKMLYQTKAYEDFWGGAKIKQQNCLKRSSRIWLLIFPVTYSRSILWYSWLLFSFILWLLQKFKLLPIVWIVKGWHCFYVPFLRDWYKRTEKYEMRTETSMDNTVNDMRYEIKFENSVKDKNNFFIKQSTAFLSWTKIYFIVEIYFFKIPKNLIILVSCFVEADVLKT